MNFDKSVTFSGKAGDVTSIDDVAKATESMTLPPAEALIGHGKKTPQFSAWRELRTLARECARSKVARRILLLTGIAMFTLVLNVIGELRMNKWQGAFFRAIETKNLADVGTQAMLFVAIMVVLLTFVVTQNWLVERVKIRIREWLTKDLLGEWMKHGHAYRLNMTSSERLNPDQRIQEDVKNFSEFTGDLGIGAARASMMLVSFVGLLWVMSSGISFEVSGHNIAIPGYMVWFALLYAGLGSWLAARVGSPLITLNEERYGQEAQFRYSLVRVSDNAESISFYSGEKDERKIVDRYLNRVLETMKTLAFANAKLTWIACGHGWLVVILPVIVALPGYLQGKLDFGGLMMVVGAFNQVQTSLRWFVENFGRIAEWRAALHRVVVFREAVLTVDDYENVTETIHLEPHPLGFLEFQKTAISLVDGKVVIADATALIKPGERVLLEGQSGSGKSTLLRAVGGLWPWGSGKILLPPRDEMMFLPQKPYIPLGSLAQAITYPNAHGDWSDEDLADCLIRVNLESFVPMIHDVNRWDKMMSLGQQQRLAFARLLLHQPKWIFLDEATSALDDENQHTMMSLLTDELAGSAVLSVGHRNILEQYHTRTLHLEQSLCGQVLTKKKPNSMEPKKKTFLRKLGSKFRQATANA